MGFGTVFQTWLNNQVVKAINSGLNIVPAPAHHNSQGNINDVAFDTGYFYICYAVNSWARIAYTSTSF